MNRSLFSLLTGLTLLASASSPAAVQAYKVCQTGNLQPTGFAAKGVGPFRIVVQFDNTGYFVNFNGLYGARNPQPINETIRAVRTNSTGINGESIFNLDGRGEAGRETLVFTLALPDTGANGFVRLDNYSKSSWSGRVVCR